MNTRICTLVVTVLFLASLTAAAQQRFEKKFSVSSGGTLTLSTDEGSVKIISGSSSEVSVVADIRGRERDVKEFEVGATQSGNNVDVTGKLHKNGWFWNSVDLDVEFTVSVPHEYSLKLHTAGGNISVSAVKGSVRGKTSGGNVSVGGTEGDVDLETSGGNVDADKCNGNLRMRTSGGEIQITSTTGDLDVQTSGGDVRITDVDGRITAGTSGGNMYLKLKGANKGIHVETSGGDIEIAISKNASANIDAGTSGGGVHFDFPVTVSGHIDESHVQGTLNGGGNTIYAHTSGGDIRFRSTD